MLTEATAETADAPTDPNDLTDASRALLYGEEDQPAQTPPPPASSQSQLSFSARWLGIMAAAILLLAGLLGWWVAGRLTGPPTPSP
jgi:hypothetical protein